jgi:hypothetical protein
MTLERRLQAGSNFVSVLIGVALGAAIASTDGLAAFLGTWQTLIAGILAVAAAAITIVQMQKTDEEQHRRHIDMMTLNRQTDQNQQQRHDDIVRLGVRGDRLRAERLRDIWSDSLVDWADRVPPVTKRGREFFEKQTGNKPFEIPVELSQIFRGMWDAFYDLHKNQTTDLFGGSMTMNYDRFVARYEQMKKEGTDAFFFPGNTVSKPSSTILDGLLQAMDAFDSLAEDARQLAKDMQGLAAKYQ